jgi:hypothetical protein
MVFDKVRRLIVGGEKIQPGESPLRYIKHKNLDTDNIKEIKVNS